ncbi:MAG: hypothetical protein KAJ30_00780 [Candidatus Heimdallarchaeota archaeon]|nr:hypothetical protein [Thermodesulfovibrionia bacterium]MCK5408771.1 hypothetical protein [Candidatus Heimdallarchaeota archaeon]
MGKATKLDFTTIGYNNNLDKGIEEVDSITDKTGLFSIDISGDNANYVDDINKKVSGQDLDDLWVSSWIKSRNYKPKTTGFKLDGKTGIIECTGLDAWGGTITGATFQTGTIGERVIISEDNIAIYDSNNKLRIASDDGWLMFWRENGFGSGGIYGYTGFALVSEDDIYLNANAGTNRVVVAGDIIPNDDATYDLGSYVYKFECVYIDKKIRFDYDTNATISQVSDTDVSYTRITFGASGGNMSFHRNVDMGSTYKFINHINPTDDYDVATKKYIDDSIPAEGANKALSNLASVAINTALLPSGSYSLGSASDRWNTLRLDSNVYFYSTGTTGFVWDASGDNAQFYYDNPNNKFIITKALTAVSIALTGNITLNGTVDGVDIASHASGSSSHHSSTSNSIAITPASYVGGAITCNSGSIDQTDTGGRIRQHLCGIRSKAAPGNPASGEVYIYYNSSNNNLEVKFSDGTVFVLCNN